MPTLNINCLRLVDDKCIKIHYGTRMHIEFLKRAMKYRGDNQCMLHVWSEHIEHA